MTYSRDASSPLLSHSHKPCPFICLISLFQALLIFSFPIQVVIKCKTVTFHRYRSINVKILSIFLLFFNFLYVKMVLLHYWLILNILILVVNQMISISLIHIKSWATITLIMMSSLMYMVMNAQVHQLIFWFLKNILI